MLVIFDAYDAHSGLYYLSQRYYDPATCQFITKDPAKADGEESAYQYCGGDPVGKTDPSGEAFVAVRSCSKSGTLRVNIGATQYYMAMVWSWDGAKWLTARWSISWKVVSPSVTPWAYYTDAGGIRRRVTFSQPSGAIIISKGSTARTAKREIKTGWMKSIQVGVTLYGSNSDEGSGLADTANLSWKNPWGSTRKGAITWCH